MFECTGRDNCAKVAVRERRGLKFDEVVEESNSALDARLKILEERLSADSSEHQERLTTLEAASLTKQEWVDLLQRVVELENSRTNPIASDTSSPPDTAKSIAALEKSVAALEKAAAANPPAVEKSRQIPGIPQQASAASPKKKAKAELARSSSHLDLEPEEESPLDALQSRVAIIETFVEEERQKAKEAKRAEVEASYYQLDVQDPPEDLPKKTPSKTSDFRNVEHLHHEVLDSTVRPLATSTWECLLFIGVPSVGFSSSCMLILSVIVNIVLQSTFVLIAIGPGKLTEDFLPSTAAEEAKAWRHTDGHSVQNMDQASWTSLVDRVCGFDETLITSTGQSEILKAIDTYLSGVPGKGSDVKAGPLLFCVVLVVWTLSITKEVCSVYDYVLSILMLPRASHSDLSRSDDGKYVLASSTSCRVIGSLVLAALRLVIALMLFYIGAMWLAKTSSLTELVLNAAALAFVLDLDELVYENLTPFTVKHLLDELEGFELPSTMLHGFDTRPPAVFVITIVCVVVFLQSEVRSMTNRMVDVRFELCERGSRHFVVGQHSEYGFAVASWTNPPTGNKRDLSKSYIAEATGRFMNIEGLKDGAEISADVEKDKINVFLDNDNPWPGLWTWNKAYFDSSLKRTEAVLGNLPISCDDLLNPIQADTYVDNFRMVTEGLTLSAWFRYGDKSATTCEALTQNAACLPETATDLRFLCSQTCGCSYPRAGLLQSMSGCLDVCAKERFDNFIWYNCQDLSKERLVQHKVIFVNLGAMSQSHADMETAFTNLFETQGCAFLSVKNRKMLTIPGVGKEQIETITDMLCGRNFYIVTSRDPTKLALGSLRPWCPVSCGCIEQWSIDCPHSCSAESVYGEEEEEQLNPGKPVNLNHPACDGGLCRASRLKPAVMYKNVTFGDNVQSCWSLDLWLRSMEGEDCSIYRGPDFNVAKDLCCEDL